MNGDPKPDLTPNPSPEPKSQTLPEAPKADQTPQPAGFFHDDAEPTAEKTEKLQVETPNVAEVEKPPVPPMPEHDPLVWTSLAVAGQKSKAWFGALLLVSVLVAAVVYLVSKDVVSTGAIVVVAVGFGAFSIKKPHSVHYALDNGGITVGQKHFVFAQFRSFSIIDEGGYTSISLAPLKRFAPFLPISYDPQLHEQIVTALAEHLPLEAHKRDALDQIISSLKF